MSVVGIASKLCQGLFEPEFYSDFFKKGSRNGNGKSVCHSWFLCKLICFIQCGFFYLLKFFICLQVNAEF